MTITEITKRLIGAIEPVGDTNIDEKRFENLRETCDLVDNLLREIKDVAKNKDKHEYSVKRAGKYADEFIKFWLKED